MKSNILVVDSENSLAATTRELYEASYMVLAASNSAEALKLARTEMPALIILGCLMPRGTSFKLHKELKEGFVTKDICQLVVDVSPEEHSRKGWTISEGMQMLADDYISYPLEAGELKEVVDRLLERTTVKTIDLSHVLAQMEVALKRIDKIEKLLVR